MATILDATRTALAADRSADILGDYEIQTHPDLMEMIKMIKAIDIVDPDMNSEAQLLIQRLRLKMYR